MSHLRLPEVLAGPHRLLSRVELRPSSGIGAGVALPFTRWQMSWDETRAPRAELKVDVATPTDLATRMLLDPRAPTRCRLWIGHRIDGVPDRLLVANVGLRLNSAQDPEGTTVITARGDEALMIDNAPSADTASLSGATVTAAIASVITGTIPGAVVNVTSATGGATSIPAPTYTDKWAAIDDLADRISDADVYDDGLGVWWIAPRPQVASVPVWTFTRGRGTARISQASTLDREGWANRVLLTHRYTTAGGVATVVQSVRSITSGPLAAVAGNVRTVEVKRTTTISASGADTAAASLVKRYASRGRAYSIRHVAIPWLRPGMTVAVEVAPGTISRHIVSSVMIDSSGWAETTTRYPDGSTIGP